MDVDLIQALQSAYTLTTKMKSLLILLQGLLANLAVFYPTKNSLATNGVGLTMYL